ncbi:unnamed protein product, partial [Mesorhabditis belari]|uniref:PHD-type domain-containing protein n=1 Tax=Mesorhabditis belari TaxID=2138241 RepID=A0AAF3EES9_9BILA
MADQIKILSVVKEENQQGPIEFDGNEGEPSTSKIGDEPHENGKLTDPKMEADGESDEEDALQESAAASKEARSSLQSDPSFATIASFLNQFGALLTMKPLSFEKLESLFLNNESDGSLNKELVDLHVTLLRRIRYNGVRSEMLGKFLSKFCEFIPALDAEYLQLSRYGYANLSLSSRLAILKSLCEAQFDYNLKFRETIQNECRGCELRLLPLGIDKNGLAYWYQQDSDFNIRIYTEEQEDLAGCTWNLIAQKSDEFDEIFEKLKQEDLGYKKKESDGKEKKEVKTHDENGKLIVSLKTGTFIDVYHDDQTMKQRREKRAKEKEERRRKREGVPEKGNEERKRKKDETDDEEEEQKEDEIPMELGDRRLLPRRSARAAVEALHKMATPQRKSVKKKVNNVKDEESRSRETSKDASESEEDEDEEEEDGEDDDEDEDDEFKLAEKKNKTGIKRKRRPKQVEASESESGDDEEEVVKERKKANEESNCKKCLKSDRWDVLLLCDNCDDAWHTDCLHPPLWYVPDDDWFCPKCLHGMLIARFELVKSDREKSLKTKQSTDAKKRSEAERLRREMEYIGISIKNIIPVMQKGNSQYSSGSDSDEEEDEEDTRKRKSKSKAIKRIAPRIRSTFERQVLATIAEGRTKRRTAANIDYSFAEYENLIKEAVEIEEGGPKPQRDEGQGRPTGGMGNKDMNNIIEAEKRRTSNEEEDEEQEQEEEEQEVQEENKEEREEQDEEEEEDDGEPRRKIGQDPLRGKGKKKKTKKRLNDLDSDPEESDVSEYRASEDSEPEEENDLASGSEYVPSDLEGRKRRTGTRRTRGFNGPTASDEEFVVSESDGSDLGYRGRREKERREKGQKKKKGKYDSLSEEEDDSEWSDDSTKKTKKRVAKGKALKDKERKRKWENSDEEEEEEEEEETEGSEAERNKRGGRMRKAAAWATKKTATIEKEEDEESEESEEEVVEEEGNDDVGEEEGNDHVEKEEATKSTKKKEKSPKKETKPPPKGRKRKAESSDEFTPEEDEGEDEEEDEDEEEEQKDRDDESDGSSKDERPPPTQTQKKTQIVADTERRAPPPKAGLNKVTPGSSKKKSPMKSPSKSPPKAKASPPKVVKKEATPEKMKEKSNEPSPTPSNERPNSAGETKTIANLQKVPPIPPSTTARAPPTAPPTNVYAQPPTGSYAGRGYYPPHSMHPGMPSDPYRGGPAPRGMPVYSPYGNPPSNPYAQPQPPIVTYSVQPSTQQHPPMTSQPSDPYSQPQQQAPPTTQADDGSLGGALASAMGTDY